MPHGESWFSLLLKKLGIYDGLHDQAHHLGWPFNDQGRSWFAGQPIELQHVFGALLVLLILVAIAIVSSSWARDTQKALVPEGRLTIRSFTELFVGATYGMMRDIMGAKAAKFFLPLIGTCAFFIFFSNVLGLVPGFLPPTDNLNTTVACAVVIFLATHIFGVKEHGPGYFKHFFGPIIKWYALPLMLLMLVIETISHFVRPVSLSLRLMANIFADHLVLGIFLGILGVWAIFLPAPAIIMLLGTVVVVVQTLVFCILSTVYIAMAIQHEEH
jgi:F-type H+-transporting ATPase subunit a